MKYKTFFLLGTLFLACNFQDQKKQEKLIKDKKNPVEIKDERTEKHIIKLSKDSKLKQIKELENILKKFPELKTYALYTEIVPFFITGDFYGDNIEDIAVLIKDSSEVKLCIINFGKKNSVAILGNGEQYDPHVMTDYSWVGEFKKVDKGEVLWSNYKDDFRDFEDVPENEKVKLNYDAIFVHLDGGCGGGFIFWKDEKFNWLQQE